MVISTAISKGLMGLCFVMAIPLTLMLMVHPAMILDEHGHYNHGAITLVMIGISAGFIVGVGFKPQFWLWRALFNPYLAIILMSYGYYLWLA